MLSAIVSTNSPSRRARTIVPTILIAFGILVVALWAAVGVSVVMARQSALDHAYSEGRNLMIAFREEVATILRGGDSKLPSCPFGQVDGGLARRHNGTGLGLLLARELAWNCTAARSAGVASEKGRGTMQ